VSIGTYIDEFVRNPPWWMIAILIAILTAHALDKLIEFVMKRRGHNGLIPILELFIVFVIGFLVVHSYYESSIKTTHEDGWANQPFALVIALALFGLGSIALYIVFSRTVEAPRQRNRRGR
jgi:protein-S-isoprenylcysteine O-methyltransferase Ste14